LVDFQRHWPTDEPGTYIDFIRDGSVGEGSKRMRDDRRRSIRRAGDLVQTPQRHVTTT
jgi:hypothetical protein